MDESKGDQKYLGLDTNVLVAFLDKEHPDNPKTEIVAKHRYAAVNPTITHEAYHTLVYKQKWMREQATKIPSEFISVGSVLFLEQTKSISRLGLQIGTKYELGGRDALILATFLANPIEKMMTFDKELLVLKKISAKAGHLQISSPT